VSDEKRSVPPQLAATTFKPGQSGNPSGRTRGLERQVRDLIAAQRHTDDKHPERAELDGWAVMTLRLFDIAMGKNGVKDRDSIEAIKVLKDRGYGKARQTVDVSGDLRLGGARIELPPELTPEQLDVLTQLDEGLDDPGPDR
jgi:hypothetical protein